MNIETYRFNHRVFNQNDRLSNGITSLEIKRIFELYGKTYISYDFENEYVLHTEEVELFVDTKSDFTTLVVVQKTLSPHNNPPCCQGQ